MPTSVELREKRATLHKQMQEIHGRATAEKRLPTAEERQQFDRIDAEIDALQRDIEQLEGDEKRAKRLADLDKEMKDSAGRRAPSGEGTRDKQERGENRDFNRLGPAERRATEEYARCFGAYLAGGERGLYRARETDLRALQSDSDIQGGYLVAPVQWVDKLIQALDNAVFMRQLAMVETVNGAQSLGAPSLDADPEDGDWTAEVPAADIDEDSAMVFGKRELTPHELTKAIRISMRLLQMSPRAESLVRDRMAYKFSVTQENAFLNGNGVKRPLGVFTASNDGIPTSRDIYTGSTTTAVTADSFIYALYNLKGQYQRNASWILSRTLVRNARLLKDGEGRYLWSAGLAAGEPDMILSRPFYMSEYVPATFTAGLYVGIVGDFKAGYWIAQSNEFAVQRLNELHAYRNQVGFIGRAAADGMPVLSEAFSRMALAP